MSISTPLTARLGIRNPILLAPMDVIAGARLTSAVSAAGASPRPSAAVRRQPSHRTYQSEVEHGMRNLGSPPRLQVR